MNDVNLGKVNKNDIEKNIDTLQNVLISKTELEKNNLRKAELMFAVGFESRPSKNDKIIVFPFGKSKRNMVAVGGKNDQTPLPVDGERRITSTNEAGDQVIATIYLDAFGMIKLIADDDIEIFSDSNVDINADNNITLDAVNEIKLQSGTDFAVRYSALESLINSIQANFNFFVNNTYNVHTHVTQGFTSSAPTPLSNPISLDPSPAKIDDIRVP